MFGQWVSMAPVLSVHSCCSSSQAHWELKALTSFHSPKALLRDIKVAQRLKYRQLKLCVFANLLSWPPEQVRQPTEKLNAETQDTCDTCPSGVCRSHTDSVTRVPSGFAIGCLRKREAVK